jgi:ring-1,2-phenylacetyl-CoA epoxidase subunit PaaC
VTSEAVAGTQVRPQALARYCLALGDDALILTQRLGEWMSRAPQIEEDMALGNIALDLLGQARTLLTYAGEVEASYSGKPVRSEDGLAFYGDERVFRCVRLVEQPRGDFAFSIARQLVFSTYQHALYSRLASSPDETLAGIAAKAVKEVDYHRDHAEQWTLRLGDGTQESHARMQAGLDGVWPYVDELFTDTEDAAELAAAGVVPLPSSLREECEQRWAAVIEQATLQVPEPTRHSRGGRDGIHSEHLGYVLAEMQHIPRSHPGATW